MMKQGPSMEEEESARRAGCRMVAGVDEAGRGPLAGPVVAAAVVLPEGYVPDGLNDSKQLTERKREKLFDALMQDDSVLKGVACASVEEIDALNILRATHLAMARAVAALPVPADFCLVDGLPVKGLPVPHRAIVKGDAKCLSIAAASVLAKVFRDRLMAELDREFPVYGFARHKGYGTKVHLDAIHRYGITVHHRRSFGPVAQMALPFV